jgi:ribonuclease HI
MKYLPINDTIAQYITRNYIPIYWCIDNTENANIKVNDTVDLISETSKSKIIAQAKVIKIVQKPLEEITEEDYANSQFFYDKPSMLEYLKQHYNFILSPQTRVKIIYLNPITTKDEVFPTTKKLVHEAKLMTDGGSRGNPGPSAGAFAIIDMSDNLIISKGIYLGITTNNQAEYQALKFGLEEARAQNIQTIHVYMDSLLVVNQMRGIFKVKNRDLWPIHDSVQAIAGGFRHISFTHIPRELNKIADSIVNDTLDSIASSQ